MSVSGGGPSSRLDPSTKSSEGIETISIDDFSTVAAVAIDFIKMDIEGAERSALAGSIATIIRDRPKLAISIYHSLDDLLELPTTLIEHLDSRDVSYRFYLDHFTIHGEETILFAQPR